MSSTKNESSVFAAVVGIPNVGKSTLMNHLIGAKISIASPRPQTTRKRVMGVITLDNTQYVFYDTPGFLVNGNLLAKKLSETVRDTFAEADCILFVTDPKKEFSDVEKELLEAIRLSGKPIILVINKCDTVSGEEASLSADALSNIGKFDSCVLLSAQTGKGCEKLFEAISGYGRDGFYYDEDTLTDSTEREIAADLIREQLLYKLRDEIPHGCAVSIENWKERPDGVTDIEATIYCSRESHKGIIIGSKGAMLKKIGISSRIEIEKMTGFPVNLKLWVKVSPDWQNKDYFVKKFSV